MGLSVAAKAELILGKMTRTLVRAFAPPASSPSVRRVMQANVGREPLIERRLRSELHRLGLRFRKNFRPLAGKQFHGDVVFRTARVCVFVDGCFWHGCKKHFKSPKANRHWWKTKITANRRHDQNVNYLLRKSEWVVLRFWEHDVLNDPFACAVRVYTAIAHRTETSR